MPPNFKKSINQADLENGTNDQIVKHLEREMELNGLEADEPLVKTQIAVTRKEQNVENQIKNKMRKSETKTPKTVPNRTLKSDHCRNCKDASHAMGDCPKLAKPRKLEKKPKHRKMPELQHRR